MYYYYASYFADVITKEGRRGEAGRVTLRYTWLYRTGYEIPYAQNCITHRFEGRRGTWASACAI